MKLVILRDRVRSVCLNLDLLPYKKKKKLHSYYKKDTILMYRNVNQFYIYIMI